MKKLFLVMLFIVCTLSTNAFASWLQIPNTEDWMYLEEGNIPAKNKWICIDTNGDSYAEWYYFDNNGIMLKNTLTPDGYMLNNDGQWVVDNVVQIQQIATKSSKIDTTNMQITTSSERKRDLKANIVSKQGVDIIDVVKIGSKTWANALKMSYNDSFLKANSGICNTLEMEVGIKNYNEELNYQMTIFVNGQELETIDDFSSEPEELSFEFDSNSEIMITYNCTSESGTYVSSDSKNLYINKGTFIKRTEE